jgi:hypothetical protein
MKITAKRRKLALFTALIMALALWTAMPLQASADTDLTEITDDGTYTYILVEPEYLESGEPTTATITKYEGQATTLNIPPTVGDEEYPVTEIAGNAFPIPDRTLQTVNIPASVAIISAGTFSYTLALTTITVDGDNQHYTAENGVLFSKDETILVRYPAAKSGDENNEYVIPDVASIDAGAFSYCTQLTGVTIPNSVTSIGQNAFSGCTALTEIMIPNSVENMGAQSFNGCTSLASITLPDSITTIPDRAFIGCKITSIVLPESVTSIGGAAFEACELLQTINLKNVESIGVYAFNGCIALKNVTLSNDITSIEEATFANCLSLTSITLPEGVTSIGKIAFVGCTSLQSVTMPTRMEIIEKEAFQRCSKLTAIIIPDGVTTLNGDTFIDCTSLASVTIPASVTTLDYRVFYNCSNLTKVTALNADPNATINASAFNSTSASVKFWCYYGSKFATQYSGKTVFMLKGITLDEKLALHAGDTKTLNVGYDPADNGGEPATPPYDHTKVTENVSDKVNWTSSNPGVARIDSLSGAVTAVANGKTTITALVVAQSGVKTATCEVVVAPPATITSFTLAGETGVITENPVEEPDDPLTGTIEVTVPAGTELTSLTPEIVYTGTIADATSSKNFGDTTPVTYTVTDTNDASRTYTVIVTVAETAKDITSFKIGDAVGIIDDDSVDSDTKGTITLEVPYGTKVTRLTPTIEVSTGATVSPASGVTKNFLEPVTYTVTGAGSSGTKEYIVTVTLAPTPYTVTVKSGSGSGSYLAGDSVSIIAGRDPVGEVFDTWTANGVTLSSANDPVTSFTMPANNVTVTATYKPAPATPPLTYAVTVNGGTGSGEYAAGEAVYLTAGAAPDGKVFDAWTTASGVIFANANNASTAFTMPAKAVSVTATYKDAPQGTGGDPDDPDNPNPPDNPPATDSGWVYENGAWKYLANGAAKTGWVYDQSRWYHLNASGIMQTGWVYDQSDKAWYYLAGNGAMVAGKWLHDTDGNWYYLSGNGKMLTGKQTIGGKTYTFKGNGVWVS